MSNDLYYDYLKKSITMMSENLYKCPLRKAYFEYLELISDINIELENPKLSYEDRINLKNKLKKYNLIRRKIGDELYK